jgi:N-methylhydantoinase A
VIGARVAAQGQLPPPTLIASGEPLTKAGSRAIVFDLPTGPVETAIWRTSFPPPGTEVAGPAIIEFPGQSVVIPPGGAARADDMGNLHVSIAA